MLRRIACLATRGVGDGDDDIRRISGIRNDGDPTERDALFRVLAAERDPSATRMSEVMTPQPQTLTADEPFLRALRVMHEGRFRHLPVVEQGRPIGIVSVRDALDEDLAELRFDLEQREEARE